MKVTVLPVRDPQRPDRAAPARPSPSAPAQGGGLDGLPSSSIELLRGARKRVYAAPPASLPARGPALPARAPVTTGEPPTAQPAPPAVLPSPSARVGTAETSAEPRPAAQASMEIELTNGRIVRVPPGFAPADLERVLAIASGDEPPRPPAPPRDRRDG